MGAWRAARVAVPDLTEDETREALCRLDPLWDNQPLPDRPEADGLLLSKIPEQRTFRL